MALRPSVRMLRPSSSEQSLSTMTIPVNSGRIDDGWPKTGMLRGGSRPPIETYAAPIAPIFFREPSMAATRPLRLPVYAGPTGPSTASREERHERSKGTTPSAVSVINSSQRVSLLLNSMCRRRRSQTLVVSAAMPALPPSPTCASIICRWMLVLVSPSTSQR